MNQLITSVETTQILAKLLSTGNSEDIYYKVMDFWDDPEIVQWFLSRGYTLYKRIYIENHPDASTVPAIPFDEVAQANYPYAHYNARPYTKKSRPLCAYDSSGKVVYAQDSERRHVAIKLVLDDSEEYRILCFLREQGFDTLKENCIIPILDLVPFRGFWLAVMPRWGIHITEPKNHTMREILHIMHSMLKGLAFLHTHNIIHRDMKMENALVNHFDDDNAILDLSGYSSYNRPSHGIELRKQGKLLYALMDFNISIMVPRNIRKEDYQRPYRDSFDGSGYHPYDTAQGEFDYNPFAFDVGTLGVVFCEHYQPYTRHIPMLAPLLDKMTTRDIGNRFTAAEALHFFEQMRADLTEDQLNMKEDPKPEWHTPYDKYDRWSYLPADFQRKWAAYRQPPTPLMTKILRAICYSEYLPSYFIPSIRLFFFRLIRLPRSIWQSVRFITSR
ncbi:other/AgaK1 protein kinase [Pholiota molesta]|nr:other/AgaK1 protein kinase [Pholiota molesta]